MMRHIFLLFWTVVFAGLVACAATSEESPTVNHQPFPFRSTIEVVTEPEPFSYEEHLANLGPGSDYPAWRDSGFRNTSPATIETPEDVIDLARAECTVMHNHICIFRDEDAGMWAVLFYTDGILDSGQTVYIDDNGITQMTIFG